MTPKLIRSRYVDGAVAWADEEDEGHVVGETSFTLPDLKARLKRAESADDREFFAVEVAAREFASTHAVLRNSSGAIVCPSAAIQSKPLACCKEAVRVANGAAPWPAWAVEAKANGWRPPRGWKP